MRKFILSVIAAIAVAGAVSVPTAEAQWRRGNRWNGGYYPSYNYSYTSPYYYSYSPGYSSYYYSPGYSSYYDGSYYSPGNSSYYYTPYNTYYAPGYYGGRWWRGW